LEELPEQVGIEAAMLFEMLIKCLIQGWSPLCYVFVGHSVADRAGRNLVLLQEFHRCPVAVLGGLDRVENLTR
ncbi:hypothetical protein QQ73_17030, partial [Candidatus Endoriftia persephone str. Guaymas]|nr:hypothetical protein [Candidatus Endoriftia persephone str. Guaymas]